ncbi:hypothetical protein KAU34_09635 [candidate division WOR-3 bacterium]|nr:hypothetical protein [candidate division WOR-3 bacterium]
MINTPKSKDREVIKPPVLFSETQSIINKIESILQGDLICYWNSQNGSICNNDIIGFYEILKKVDLGETLYLFIKSAGGDGRASLRIINLIRKYVKRIVALIPLECSSAATMLALGTDEIHMGALAYLSAVDTSITHKLSPIDKNNVLVSVSQDELGRVIRLWNKESQSEDFNPYSSLYQYIHPLVIGAVDRASSLSIKLCKEILSYHQTDKKKAEEISNHLNSDYPSHSYPITYIESKKIGLNAKPIDANINDLLIKLSELYSEMGQRAYTDFDDLNYHDNEILNILEGKDVQFYYQVDRDWHYRTEERRWVSLNDNSSWRKIEIKDGKMVKSKHHIR